MKSALQVVAVDDRPENLIALEAILQSPNYDLVLLNTGAEEIPVIFFAAIDSRDTYVNWKLSSQKHERDSFKISRGEIRAVSSFRILGGLNDLYRSNPSSTSTGAV